MPQPRPLSWPQAGHLVSNSYTLSAKHTSRLSHFSIFRWTQLGIEPPASCMLGKRSSHYTVREWYVTRRTWNSELKIGNTINGIRGKCTEWPQMTLNHTQSKLPHICVTRLQESHISLRFALRPAIFDIQAILRQWHRTIPKWPSTLQGHMCPICVTSIHESHISLRFALRPAVFEIQAILRQEHRMTPNWSWTLQGQITPYRYNNCPRVPSFTLFRSTSNRFQVTGHFDTSALNDPKMTLNTGHQILEMHPMTPNWTWTLNSQKYSIYTKYLPLRPKFCSVLLYN